MSTVRTRFAPSPTGALHAGAVRTALFAWLIARQNDGQFILRIEDTDRAREQEGATQNIIDSLHYLNIQWDEGPDVKGPFGPYTQSERIELYWPWAQKLIDSGRAYADPYSPDQVEEFRQEAKKNKKPFLFRDYRPDNPPEWNGSTPLRFKSDPKAYDWVDEVMGKMHSGPEAIDDFILIKSDGFPTYNFAHIVDDALMEITHVIRSQEFISSVPNYLNLYEALGIQRPFIATVPSVLREDGKKKLGKRDGAKQILDYKKQGILPAALINFLATLGWNDGSDQEIYSVDELIVKFSPNRVQKSGAQFDERRLLWLNGHYIRALNQDDLYGYAKDYWPPEASNFDDAYKKRVLAVLQERLKYFGELPELSLQFFVDLDINPSLISSSKQLSALSSGELRGLLYQTKTSLEASDFSAEDLTNKLNDLLEQTGQKPAVLFSLIRIATTWAQSSPGLADTLSVLGKDKSLERINKSLEYFSKIA
jgi:glutamyl-tRNA synthetase